MTEEELKAIEERSLTAHEIVVDLCHGKRQWLMSIPARPDYDPDLVIGESLRDTRKLVAEVRRLRALLAIDNIDNS